MLSDYVLFLQFAYCQFQFVIPFLAKTADQRLLEALVDGKSQSLTFYDSRTAYVPSVVIDPPVWSKFLDTNGVEMA